MNKVAFLTMDVESYFDTSSIRDIDFPKDPKYCCAEEISSFLSLLDKYQIKATFFVTASFIKEAKPYLLEAIKKGHEIALHCLEHHSYKKHSKEEFKKEIQEAKKILLKELGVEPVGFRFPKFQYRDEFFLILKEEGFIYDSSVTKMKKPYTQYQDNVYFKNGLYEFSPVTWRAPLKIVKISAGSFSRFMMNTSKINSQYKYIDNHNSFVFYFHPFEIHKGELPIPKKGLNKIQKRYLTVNREHLYNHIEYLIKRLLDNGYSFSSMKDYCLKNNK